MAHVEQACRSTKYHSHSAAAQMSGAQPRRECLAVHARQLAVEPCIQILYRYPRSLLLRMEQPHRSAMAHHVTRSARLGAPVSIIESWYKPAAAVEYVARKLKDEVEIVRRMVIHMVTEYFELLREPLEDIID